MSPCVGEEEVCEEMDLATVLEHNGRGRCMVLCLNTHDNAVLVLVSEYLRDSNRPPATSA